MEGLLLDSIINTLKIIVSTSNHVSHIGHNHSFPILQILPYEINVEITSLTFF